ncbi:Glu/Leu/Phe/Val dehydrogenase, partial [Candidatus Woesearchaeota archaeon]|nr:Glu/Leu/Phe/Val dehydrogenase [Candidatus Woesearchaeota archaeon]
VGMNTARFLFEKGAKIIAIADINAIIYNPDGLDIEELRLYALKNGTIKAFPGKEITNDEFFSLDADILVPAAISNVITKDNVDSIKAKGIVEAANMPIHYKAEKILAQKGIRIIPDIIANAGGVIASGEEYSKSLSAKYTKKEETYAMITKRIIENLNLAKQIAREHDVSLNLACYILALRRIYKAQNIRGWV